MKKLFAGILGLWLVFTVSAFGQDKERALPEVLLFYSSHCKACLAFTHEFLPKVEETYKGRVKIVPLNIADEKNLSMLLALAGRHEKNGSTPAILAGDEFFSGRKDCEAGIVPAIEKLLIDKSFSEKIISSVNMVELFKQVSVLTILAAGLIDGVNPCAFAVVVFFVSFLAVYGYRKREIFYVGTAYCLAVFLTYLFIGLGFFKFLYSLSGFYKLIKIFYYMVAGFCFALALAALADYLKFRKTGEGSEMILQLPEFLKKKINFVIGKNLREKKDTGPIGLMFSAFLVGFLVSLLEAVCTGQVYLPTIVFILKNTELRLKAVGYLLLYNLMFILPLIFVFALSLWGFSSQKFNDFLKKNIGRIKILMSGLFLALGFVILLFA